MATDFGIGVAMLSSLCGVGSTSSGAGVGSRCWTWCDAWAAHAAAGKVLEHSLLADSEPDICGGGRV